MSSEGMRNLNADVLVGIAGVGCPVTRLAAKEWTPSAATMRSAVMVDAFCSVTVPASGS